MSDGEQGRTLGSAGLFGLGNLAHAELHTSPRVKELAAKALHHPETMTHPEIAELAGSVMRHIERHGGRSLGSLG